LPIPKGETASAGDDPARSGDAFDPDLVDLKLRPDSSAFGVLSKDELKALDGIVQGSIAGHEVVNVYIFDRERRITYSTNMAHVGFTIGPNPHYDAANGGTVSSVQVARGSPVDVDQARFGIELLEVYVPMKSAAGVTSGVIEIYVDASALESDVRAGTSNISLVSLAGFLALASGLWFIVRSAQEHLEKRTAALVATNQTLVKLSQRLEQLAEKRGQQLSRAQILASIGTLAAGVAHEVNNPIATIASCAEGLLRRRERSDGAPDARFSEYLELIRDEAYRVKGITRNLLDFARPTKFEAGPVDLRECLEATITIVEFQAKTIGAKLSLELPEGALIVQGDAGALRQVLLNLTLNALDAVEGIEGQVIWSGMRIGSELVICCIDNGEGIAPEHMPHLFEPFYSSKDPGKGTGLGLSISERIIARHGGSLNIKSELGEGATVTIRLPEVPRS